MGPRLHFNLRSVRLQALRLAKSTTIITVSSEVAATEFPKAVTFSWLGTYKEKRPARGREEKRVEEADRPKPYAGPLPCQAFRDREEGPSCPSVIDF